MCQLLMQKSFVTKKNELHKKQYSGFFQIFFGKVQSKNLLPRRRNKALQSNVQVADTSNNFFE